jgi:uncharacterized lipoprotein YmbA
VDIQRLDMSVGQGVVLEALWSVRQAGKGEAKTGRSLINDPVTTGGYDALVAAQSRALAALCRDLVQALLEVSASQK